VMLAGILVLNFAVLPREGEPCLVVEPYWGLNALDGGVGALATSSGRSRTC